MYGASDISPRQFSVCLFETRCPTTYASTANHYQVTDCIQLFGICGSEAIVDQNAMALQEFSGTCVDDIRLGLEFLGMYSCRVNNLRTAVDVLRNAAKPNVGLTPDSFHMHLSESSLSGIMDLSATEILLVHVNHSEVGDIRSLEDSKRLFPGEGVIDLRRSQTGLESLGYRGFMSLELLRPSYWQQEPIEIARKAREALRRVFGI